MLPVWRQFLSIFAVAARPGIFQQTQVLGRAFEVAVTLYYCP